MKKASILTVMIVLFGLAGNANATSPMPEEVMPGQTVPVCTTHMVYIADPEKGILGRDSSSTIVFEASDSQKEVFEKIYKHMSNKLTEGKVAELKVECKFPK